MNTTSRFEAEKGTRYKKKDILKTCIVMIILRDRTNISIFSIRTLVPEHKA